jgi:hypothetical protein
MADTLQNERVQFNAALKILLESLNTGGGGIGGGTVTDPTRIGAINYIKAKLDELVPQGEGVTFNLSSAPNISDPLNLLISAHLEEGVKDVILSAPITVLKPTASTETTGTPFIAQGLTGYVALPGTFLRLSSFRMADWTRDAILTTPETSLGKRQALKHLCGGISKPVAVLTWRNIGTPTPALTRVIEYYSTKGSNTIAKLLYIPEQTAEVFLGANPNLMDALAWTVAGKIMQITGMVNEAKMAQERVNQSYLNL